MTEEGEKKKGEKRKKGKKGKKGEKRAARGPTLFEPTTFFCEKKKKMSFNSFFAKKNLSPGVKC